MLLYNTNGTISNIVINAIVDGKVTSSLEIAPTVQQSFETSASNAIVNKAITAGSSSNQAYQLGYVASTNTSNLGTTYLSSATIKKTYSTNSYSVLNPTNPNLHTRGMRYVATIPANKSLSQIVEDRLVLDISTPSLKDGSQSPAFETIEANKFTTTYSNGNVLVVGDDSIIRDVNLANGIGVIGQQSAIKGWVRFGNGGPLVGFNNTDAFPIAGDGLYAVTGSMLIRTNKLYFFNGGASNGGWSQII